MSALPSFGGTNGVSLLDIGQVGGTRHGESQAHATLRCLVEATQVVEMVNALVQQEMVWRDFLGTAGRPIAWQGVIRTTSDALMNTVLAEIEQKQTGRQSVTGAIDPVQMHSTQLVDSFGRTYDAVKLIALRPLGPRYTGATWTAVQQVVLMFQELGNVAG